MDYTKLSKQELLQKCAELEISCSKSKNKTQLIELIKQKEESSQNIQQKIEKDGEDGKNRQENEENELSEKNKYTMIDLFCGTGAFSYAFHMTEKVSTIFANDMLDSSEAIFNLNNFGIKLTKKNLSDIPESEIPNATILTGGFPCQPFSIAGMQKGFDDERSNVFWKILSILEKTQPEIIILENVKNLQSHDDGNTFKIIIENLQKLNYNIKHEILNTSKISGVPQNRERIYIVGFKDPILCENFSFDFPEVDLLSIVDFLESNPGNKYYYGEESAIYEKLKPDVIKNVNTNTIYQYRRYYVRENKNSVCPTLTANMGTGGHNVPIILDDKGIRKLTPRECFNLQGFPNDYILPNISDSKLYSLAGNAVSVPVVKLIANKIINLLETRGE